jgi:hypothetical protein
MRQVLLVGAVSRGHRKYKGALQAPSEEQHTEGEPEDAVAARSTDRRPHYPRPDHGCSQPPSLGVVQCAPQTKAPPASAAAAGGWGGACMQSLSSHAGQPTAQHCVLVRCHDSHQQMQQRSRNRGRAASARAWGRGVWAMCRRAASRAAARRRAAKLTRPTDSAPSKKGASWSHSAHTPLWVRPQEAAGQSSGAGAGAPRLRAGRPAPAPGGVQPRCKTDMPSDIIGWTRARRAPGLARPLPTKIAGAPRAGVPQPTNAGVALLCSGAVH